MQFECQNSNYSGPIIVALTKIGISRMGNELSGSVAIGRVHIFYCLIFNGVEPRYYKQNVSAF